MEPIAVHMQDGQGLGGTDNAAHTLTDKEGQGVGVATQILTLPKGSCVGSLVPRLALEKGEKQ